MDGVIGKSRVKDGWRDGKDGWSDRKEQSERWRDEKDETLGKNKMMKGYRLNNGTRTNSNTSRSFLTVVK